MQQIAFVPPTILALAFVVVLPLGCTTPPEEPAERLMAAEHPAEQLRGEIEAREIGRNDAPDRLDELRASIGADEPAQFHLAAALVNSLENDPEAALAALEAALEADEELVDDHIRLEIGEQALRDALSKEGAEDQIHRAYAQLLAVAPDHPQLSDWRLDQRRVQRLDDLLDSPAPDDGTLAEARDICDEGLETATVGEVVVGCARVAIEQGETASGETLLLEWLDGRGGLQRQLEAIIPALDELAMSLLDVREARDLEIDSIQWRVELAALLGQRGRVVIDELKDRGDGVDVDDQLTVVQRPLELAVATDRTDLVEDWHEWIDHYEEIRGDGEIDEWGDARRLRYDRHAPPLPPRWLVHLFGSEDLMARLNDDPDEGPATKHQFMLAQCERFADVDDVGTQHLAAQYALIHGEVDDETVFEACPFDETLLSEQRTKLRHQTIEQIRAAYARGDAETGARRLDWFFDEYGTIEQVVHYCRQFDCDVRLKQTLAERAIAVEPRADEQWPQLQPEWRAGGPLPPLQGSTPSPDGDRLATLHAGEAPPQIQGLPVDDSDNPAFERRAPTTVVVWSEETGEQLQRIELPVLAEEMERSISGAGAVDRFDWRGDHVVVAMDARMMVVDIEAGETESLLLSPDDTTARLLGPTVTDDEVVFARSAYRRGPMKLQRHRLEDLEAVTEETIWAPGWIYEWDEILGDGTVVRNTDDGLQFFEPDGAAFTIELGGVETERIVTTPDERFIYAVAENVYAIDIEEREVHTAFGACFWADDREATLSDDSERSMDSEAVPGQIGVDLRYFSANCSRSLELRSMESSRFAITFYTDEATELPYRPLVHHQGFDGIEVIDLADGDRAPVDCDGAGDEVSEAEQYLPDDPEETEGAQDCAGSSVCDYQVGRDIQGAVTNAPMLLGETDDDLEMSESVLVWLGEDHRIWERVRSGSRARTSRVRFSPDGSRLVSSAMTTRHSVAIRDSDNGNPISVLPAYIPYDVAFGDDGAIYTGSIRPEPVDTMGPMNLDEMRDGLAAARWDADETPLQCQSAADLDGEFPDGDPSAPASVRHIDVGDELDTGRLTDDEIDEEAERLVAEQFDGNLEGLSPNALAHLKDRERSQLEAQRDDQPEPVGSWFYVDVGDQWLLSPTRELSFDDYHRLDRADACRAGGVVTIGEFDDEIYIRDLDAGGELVEHFDVGDEHRVAAVAFDERDCRLAVALRPDDGAGDASHQLAVYGPGEGNWEELSRVDAEVQETATALAWHSDGWLVAATDDARAVLASPDDGRAAVELAGLPAVANDLAVADDGHRVAAGTDTAESILWELPSGDDFDEMTESTERFDETR